MSNVASHVLGMLVGAFCLVVPVAASAQAPPPLPQPVGGAASASASSNLWLGPQLDLMPSGSVHLEGNGFSGSADTSSAFGLGGLVEYRLASRVAIGLAPRLVVPVRVKNADDSGKQFDVRARLAVGGDVGPRTRINGIATIGYSWISDLLALTDQDGNVLRYQTVSGMILGFGAGFQHAINPRLMLTGEFSYQLGYQGTTVMGVDFTVSDDYLTLGVGLLAAIGG